MAGRQIPVRLRYLLSQRFQSTSQFLYGRCGQLRNFCQHIVCKLNIELNHGRGAPLADGAVNVEFILEGLEEDAFHAISLLQMIGEQPLNLVRAMLGFSHASYPEHLSAEVAGVAAALAARRMQSVEIGGIHQFRSLLFR